MSDVDQLVDISWQRALAGSQSPDFIYLSQMFTLLSEMEKTLGTRQSLFTQSQQLLLQLMIDEKPLLKLFKKDLKNFILKLAQYKDFMTLLRDRLGITGLDLNRIVHFNRASYEKFEREPQIDKRSEEGILSRPIGDNSSIFNIRKYLSPPLSPRYKTFEKRYGELDYQRNGTDSGTSSGGRSDSDLTAIKEQSNKSALELNRKTSMISDLEKETKTLNDYIETLEKQLASKTTQYDLAEFVRKIKEKDVIIKDLEELCGRYQKEVAQFKEQEKTYEHLLNSLRRGLQKQDLLVAGLKQNLKLNTPEQRYLTKEKILKLPFVKQYYYFYKYRDDQKNIGTILLNIIVLFLTAFIFLGISKCIFYVVFWALNRLSISSYIYDDYKTSDITSESTFVWWKEIEWLEYLIYSLTDKW